MQEPLVVQLRSTSADFTMCKRNTLDHPAINPWTQHIQVSMIMLEQDRHRNIIL